MDGVGSLGLLLFGIFLLVALIAVAVRWGVLLALESALRQGSATRKQIGALLREAHDGGEAPKQDPSKYL
jgi:hypothetical protein